VEQLVEVECFQDVLGFGTVALLLRQLVNLRRLGRVPLLALSIVLVVCGGALLRRDPAAHHVLVRAALRRPLVENQLLCSHLREDGLALALGWGLRGRNLLHNSLGGRLLGDTGRRLSFLRRRVHFESTRQLSLLFILPMQ
jgi:hypothetical protein